MDRRPRVGHRGRGMTGDDRKEEGKEWKRGWRRGGWEGTPNGEHLSAGWKMKARVRLTFWQRGEQSHHLTAEEMEDDTENHRAQSGDLKQPSNSLLSVVHIWETFRRKRRFNRQLQTWSPSQTWPITPWNGNVLELYYTALSTTYWYISSQQ